MPNPKKARLQKSSAGLGMIEILGIWCRVRPRREIRGYNSGSF